MGKAKSVGVGKSNTRYLGHFARGDVLRAGHNTNGEWKRLKGLKGEVLSDTDMRDANRLRNRRANIRFDSAVIREVDPKPMDKGILKEPFSQVKGLVI